MSTVSLISVPEFAVFLGKSPQRVYQIVHEGLMEDVGISVYRTGKGRIWLRITTPAFSGDVSPLRGASL